MRGYLSIFLFILSKLNYGLEMFAFHTISAACGSTFWFHRVP